MSPKLRWAAGRVELGGGGLGVGDRQLELVSLVEADGDGQSSSSPVYPARRSPPPGVWLRSRSPGPVVASPAGRGSTRISIRREAAEASVGLVFRSSFKTATAGGVIAAA